MSPTHTGLVGTVCVCGHTIEEHGHDPRYPGSTACLEDGCGCIAFEADQDYSDYVAAKMAGELD